ncbi:proopiomelanocortin a isoform X1 [Erpetoichthys calabaricus]|uniref:Proopiomelanocortin a n=2 Tax=Erpetoichthys calabaricus TaxID=27687 RepID=A0A8C4RX17_ERPCA|nr:proopiomelanocortin a isoform X1 [Erpetoichthys calabaricus]
MSYNFLNCKEREIKGLCRRGEKRKLIFGGHCSRRAGSFNTWISEMLRSVVNCVLAVLWLYSTSAQSQCWEDYRCRDLSTEANILECIETCKLDLSLETPIFPGNGHLQPPPEDVQNYIMKHFRWNSLGRNTNGTLISTSQEGGTGSSGENTPLSILLEILSPPQRQEEMEPMEGQAAQKNDNKRSYSMEHFRWGKPVGRKRRPVKVYPNGVEEESSESYPAEIRRDLSVEFSYPQKLKAKTYVNVTPHPQNKNYTIDHFRWRDPPKDKRYGGFMKSWDERSQKPLLTLFKNVMIKDGHEKKGQ